MKKDEVFGAFKSNLGVLLKDDEIDWLDYDDCVKICAMAAYKNIMNYQIFLYPKEFIDFINYWSGKIGYI